MSEPNEDQVFTVDKTTLLTIINAVEDSNLDALAMQQASLDARKWAHYFNTAFWLVALVVAVAVSVQLWFYMSVSWVAFRILFSLYSIAFRL